MKKLKHGGPKNNMEFELITFKNLSTSLKIAVILAWVSGAIFCLSFLIGFIEGILEASI